MSQPPRRPQEPRRHAWLDPDPLYVEPTTPSPRTPKRYARPGESEPGMVVAILTVLVVVVAIAIVAVVAWLTLLAPRGPAEPSYSPGAGGTISVQPALGAPYGSTAVQLAPPLEVIRGTATHYCLPGQRGTAYCTRGYGPEDLVAAIDTDLGFRKGDVVIVRSLAGPEDVTVTIVDVCGCAGDRLIDLTSGAFRRLAPLGRGVIPVTVELAGSERTLPPTDEED